MRLVLCVLSLLFLFIPGLTAQDADKGKQQRIYELPPFERAIICTKRYEGWHGSRKNLPYIGYGHKLLPKERLTHKISRAQGDSLLRADMRKLCRMFRRFGRDSLLLSEISDNKSYPNPSIILKIQFFYSVNHSVIG